jgi:hypothetical protein
MSEATVPSGGLTTQGAGFLSTEHWSLLSARSLGWNESFSRVSVFLNTLSASAVALALVADASGFGDEFKIFALVLFPIVLFLGLATYVRVVQINLEDIYLIAAMNRLRRAYVEGAPEVRRYFTSGISDDEEGLWTSYLLNQPRGLHPGVQFLTSTPTVIATLDAVIATVGAGGLAIHFGATGIAVVLLSVGIFISTWVGLFSVQLNGLRKVRQAIPRFPSQETQPL